MSEYRLASTHEIPPGTMRRCSVPDHSPVLVANLDGRFFAVDDQCSHARASLSAGALVDGCVECPRHGSRFDLATGAVRSLPAVRPIATYRLTIRNEEIFLEV